MKTNPLLAALKRGEIQYGCGFGTLRSPEFPRILGAAGFTWTFVDGEHSSFTTETMADLCTACTQSGVTPLWRVGELQYTLVARALDSGAGGILFPRVDDPEVLRRAVSWAKFPPAGVRGYGLTPCNYDYTIQTMPGVIEHFNREHMVVFQIETAEGVERRDELISVAGIDAVMVGPADLSISLGVPGDFFHPKMVDAMEKIRDTCLKYHVAPGTQTRNVELARFWKERGMLLLGCSNDTAMLFDRATEIITKLKA